MEGRDSTLSNELMTIPQAAQELGCTVDYVRRLIRGDKIPVIAYGERTRRILRSDLTKFKNDCHCKSKI